MSPLDFADFDRRHYPSLTVREGYQEWLPTYERTVEDLMDLALLERIQSIAWGGLNRVADLGCGTGRTASWLRQRGVARIDGVDVTPAMLDVARSRGYHVRLVEADARSTGLEPAAYDLVVCSLVDEHLPELTALYQEARRLLTAEGAFVLVGYHPFFIMASGMPTHFDGPDGTPVAVETYIHLLSDHVAAAAATGMVCVEMHEGVIDDAWLARKPSWASFRQWPFSFAAVWRPAG